MIFSVSVWWTNHFAVVKGSSVTEKGTNNSYSEHHTLCRAETLACVCTAYIVVDAIEAFKSGLISDAFIQQMCCSVSVWLYCEKWWPSYNIGWAICFVSHRYIYIGLNKISTKWLAPEAINSTRMILMTIKQ